MADLKLLEDLIALAQSGIPADHRNTGLATVDAVADAGNRWIFPELVDEGLEPHHVTWLAFNGTSTPSHWVDVTGEPFDKAVESLERHAAYNSALPDSFPKPPELLAFSLDASRVAVDGVERALLLDLITR